MNYINLIIIFWIFLNGGYKMEILFLGNVINPRDCHKYIGPSVAGNKMQIGILKELKRHYKNNLTIVTEIPIAVYPKEKKILIKGGNINLDNELIAEKVSFINLPIIKQITKIINAYRILKKWSKIKKFEAKSIICYNAYSEIAIPVLLLGKVAKVNTICLFADPPIDPIKRRPILKIFKKLENALFKKHIRKFDGLITLNKEAVNRYSPNSKFVLVDGGFSIEDMPKNLCGGQWRNITEGDSIKAVFSGAITEYNGIINLIEAAKLVKNPKFILEIYGTGPLEYYVEEASTIDDRIKYCGKVPNEEMMKIQQNAALLINSRIVDDPISQYTFPSKMIEYLISGTPVVSTKLNCYTDEYLESMFIFQDETPEGMAKTIDDILSMDRNILIDKATNARTFILKNKNWNAQVFKIIRFIEQI